MHAARIAALSLCVAALCAAGLAWDLGPASAQGVDRRGQIHRTLDAAADGVVQVTNFSGSVVVSGWDAPKVEVVGSVGSEVETLEVERRGQRVVVSVSQTLRRAASADLEVRVPRGSRLEVEGMQADVRVEGVEGDVTVRTMTGTVRVEGAGGRVDLQSVSGVLDVAGSVSRARLDNVSGPVRVRAEVTSLTAESVNGPLDLELDGLADARIGTVTGPVVARLGPRPGARVELSSFSGRVEVALDPRRPARIRARTRGGRVSEEINGEAEISDDGDGRRLVLVLAGGAESGEAAEIELSSFSGDLRLVAR